MVFSSFTFLFMFFPIFLLFYYVSPNKYKNLILFIFSLFFYAWGEPIYILIMIFSTINDFTFGQLIYKHKFEQNNHKKAKMFLILSIIINLSLLGFFKYTPLILDIIETYSLKINATTIYNYIRNCNANWNIALPIGISFYTFQTMSYSIDIYRGVSKPQKNIVDFGAYVAMFPQLIAGPIVSYNKIEKYLNVKYRNEKIDFEAGSMIFVLGLIEKVILANSIGNLWDNYKIFSNNGLNGSLFGNWIGISFFALQIFFDFSGYSHMAIGLGKILGFDFPQNFKSPYLCDSITDFWRRWHITLGSWFRDYVYIPLGGNRKGLKRQLINLSIVWFLTGLWHGAAYNFILWGLYFGFIIILEKIFILKILKKIPKLFSHIYSIILILIGWVLFAIEDINLLKNYLTNMFCLSDVNLVIDTFSIELILSNMGLLILAFVFIVYNKEDNWTNNILKMKFNDKYCPFCQNVYFYHKALLLFGFFVSIYFLLSSTYNPFLYFNF